MMSKEAIAHYEAALKEAFPRGATGEVFHHWNEARYLIATEALDRMAENARELGLDYDVKSDHRLMEQPAQQEPVAWMHPDGRIWTFGRGFDKATFTVPLYTRPQAREPLTDEQITVLNFMLGADDMDGVWFGEQHPKEKGAFWWRNRLRHAFQDAAIEAKLKEKNT